MISSFQLTFGLELVNSLDLVAQQVPLYVWTCNLQFMCVEVVKRLVCRTGAAF